MIDFRDLYQLEMDVIPVINRLEQRGLCWDSRLARREDCKIRRKMVSLLESDVMASVNPGSPKQVREHFLEIGMPEKLMMKKGQVTTGQEQVEAAVRHLENDERWSHVGDGIVKRVTAFSTVLTDYRHLAKVSGTYLRPFSDMAERNGGVIYPSLNPFGAVTGRMSGTGQQFPKATEKMTAEQQVVRQCVVCRDGYDMWFFDFDAMEMAVFGLVSGADEIVEGYLRGEDIHQMMADEIGQPRDITKTINFAIIYGAGPMKLAGSLGISLKQAKKLRNMYYDKFPSIKDYQDCLECELRMNGFVEDLFGRRYSLRASEAYKAANAIIQGSCASAFKTALVHTDNTIRKGENLLMVVHDELFVERVCNKPGKRGFVRRVVEAMEDIEVFKGQGLTLRVGGSRTVTNWAEKCAYE